MMLTENELSGKIDLFFIWSKQHFHIKRFLCKSENPLKTQIWCAVFTYVLIAIIKVDLSVRNSDIEQRPLLQFNKNLFGFLAQGRRSGYLDRGRGFQLDTRSIDIKTDACP